MSFDVHSDAGEHLAFQGEDGLAAFGFWSRCGSWTSANGKTGLVPHNVAQAFGDPGLVRTLVDGGIWQETAFGYRMLLGPTTDPDDPLPLWRYSPGDVTTGLFELDDTPNT